MHCLPAELTPAAATSIGRGCTPPHPLASSPMSRLRALCGPAPRRQCSLHDAHTSSLDSPAWRLVPSRAASSSELLTTPTSYTLPTCSSVRRFSCSSVKGGPDWEPGRPPRSPSSRLPAGWGDGERAAWHDRQPLRSPGRQGRTKPCAASKAQCLPQASGTLLGSASLGARVGLSRRERRAESPGIAEQRGFGNEVPVLQAALWPNMVDPLLHRAATKKTLFGEPALNHALNKRKLLVDDGRTHVFGVEGAQSPPRQPALLHAAQ